MAPGLSWRVIVAAWKHLNRADRRLADNLDEREIAMKAIEYLRARLEEPGTMRSLVWCCLSVAGLDNGETAVTYVALVCSLALGLWSALKPERK